MTLSGQEIHERRQPEPNGRGEDGSGPDEPPPNEGAPPYDDSFAPPHLGWDLDDPRGDGDEDDDERREPPPDPPPDYFPPGPRDDPAEPPPTPAFPPPERRFPPETPPPTEEEARRVIEDARSAAIRALGAAIDALGAPDARVRLLFNTWFDTLDAAAMEDARETLREVRAALASADIRYVTPEYAAGFAGDPVLFNIYDGLASRAQSAVTIAGSDYPTVPRSEWHIAVGPTFVTRPDLAPTRLVHEGVHLADPEGTRHEGGRGPRTETRRTSSWCIQGFVSMVPLEDPLDIDASRVRAFCGRL